MRARVFLVLFLAVLLAPGVAHAKGPDLATIDGAGMAAPISIAGVEGSDDDLGDPRRARRPLPRPVRAAPDPMLAAAPDGGRWVRSW